jgi:hypothetical protein
MQPRHAVRRCVGLKRSATNPTLRRGGLPPRHSAATRRLALAVAGRDYEARLEMACPSQVLEAGLVGTPRLAPGLLFVDGSDHLR